MQPAQSETPTSASRGSVRWRGIAGILLLSVFVLSVFFAPASTPPLPADPTPTLLDRIFPGIPVAWVATRLLCLLAASLLLASLPAPQPASATAVDSANSAVRTVSARTTWIALALAMMQPIVGLWAGHFSRSLQYAYVAWFALPAVTLWLGTKREVGRRSRHAAGWLIGAAVTAVWVVVCVPQSWESPLTANLMDMWVGLRDHIAALDPGFNLLTDRFQAGGGSLHFIFEGIAIFDWLGVAPSFASTQMLQYVWYSIDALALALLTARIISLPAAAIATAAFLFSPFTQVMMVTPMMMSLGSMFTIMLLQLVVRVREDRSPAALAGLGAFAGMIATFPAANLTSVTIACLGFWSAWQRPRFPWPVFLTAASTFAAALLTAMPDLTNFTALLMSHTRGRAQWIVHEMAGFGQISSLRSSFATESALAWLWDTPISALLAPFASPRIPLRLTGDTMLDPLGAALAAVGICICLVSWRRWWFARLILLLAAVGLLPVFTSSQDRISLIRFVYAPIQWALLAALGWEGIRPHAAGRIATIASTTFAAATIAIGGTAIHQYVNPRLLPASWTTLALSALTDNQPAGGSVLLDHPEPKSFPYWYLEELTSAAHWQTIVSREYATHGDAWVRARNGEVAEVIFWNPGMEEDYHVAGTICQLWSGAGIIVISDKVQSSRTIAARRAGSQWIPALPPEQWRLQGCGDAIETEASRGAQALRQARQLIASGDDSQAITLLRDVSRKSFTGFEVMTLTSELLLRSSETPAASAEALSWAQRAVLVSLRQDVPALVALAAAYRANNQLPAAVEILNEAAKVARKAGDAQLATTLIRRAAEDQSQSAP